MFTELYREEKKEAGDRYRDINLTVHFPCVTDYLFRGLSVAI